MTRKENYSPEVWTNILASNERWRLANIPRVREKERARRANRKASDPDHVELLRTQRRAWRKENRDKINAQRKRARERREAEQRAEERRAKKREYQRKWRAENRERLLAAKRESQKRYRERHPERVLEIQRRYRERNPDKVKAGRRPQNLTPEQREKKNARQNEWRRRNRDRVLAYARAYNARKRKKGGGSLAIVGEALEAALGANTLYASASAAVPRTLPRDVRLDVVSAIVLAVLEGELIEADIGREAKRFITAHYRMFDTFKTVSIDAPIPGTDGLTLADILPG